MEKKTMKTFSEFIYISILLKLNYHFDLIFDSSNYLQLMPLLLMKILFISHTQNINYFNNKLFIVYIHNKNNDKRTTRFI